MHRDKFLDVVRAGAILAVVVQHWAMPVLSYSDGHLATGNALATPGWWVITWLSQVMPLVFFAGGAANLMSLRRANSPRDWLAKRVRRLVLPVLPLMALWLVIPDVLLEWGIPKQPVEVAGAIAAQLLWFLGVYLLTVLVTPLMAAAHRRFGLAVPAVMAVAAIGVDMARFADFGLVGFANAIFVWLAVHQLGFSYAEGGLGALNPRKAFALSGAGFGITALMVIFGPYPASMIGMPGAPVSNMSPPTALLFFLAVGQIGLLLALKPKLLAFAAGPAVGRSLDWLSARFMSIYLWHMPALIVVAGITVYGLGYATPEPGTVLWLAVTPPWIAGIGIVLALLLKVFSRFEAMGQRPATARIPQLTFAALLAAGGLLGLAAHGFSTSPFGGPLPWVALTVAGYALSGRRIHAARITTRFLGHAVAVTEAAKLSR